MQLCTGLYGTPRSSSSFERTKFRNSFFSSGDEKEARQRVFVRFCITNQVPRLCRPERPKPLDYRRARIRRCRASPSHLASTAQNLLSSVPEIARPLSPLFGSTLAIHRRYTERRFFCIPYCYLQGITVRPVPCNSNVFQCVGALSRRCHRRAEFIEIRPVGQSCAVFLCATLLPDPFRFRCTIVAQMPPNRAILPSI
jgi:hypothetical protein